MAAEMFEGVLAKLEKVATRSRYKMAEDDCTVLWFFYSVEEYSIPKMVFTYNWQSSWKELMWECDIVMNIFASSRME